MSKNALEVFDTTVQKTHEWINAVAEATHLETHDAYQALRAVLQTLRDRLPLEQSAHLSAQLPMLLRGLFFEGWRPVATPEKMNREAFLAAIGEKIVTKRFVDPNRIVPEVFAVMQRFVTFGEIEKIRRSLPHDLQELWPAPVQAAL
jgi:uncharacterized protein (DUF2267 family)